MVSLSRPRCKRSKLFSRSSFQLSHYLFAISPQRSAHSSTDQMMCLSSESGRACVFLMLISSLLCVLFSTTSSFDKQQSFFFFKHHFKAMTDLADISLTCCENPWTVFMFLDPVIKIKSTGRKPSWGPDEPKSISCKTFYRDYFSFFSIKCCDF